MSNSPSVENLKNVLQNTFTFYFTAHHHHWNIEGAQFMTLHKLFEDQYQDAFEALDEIAERIRGLDTYVHISSDNATQTNISGKTAEDRAKTMVENLIELNQGLVSSLKDALDNIEKADDPITEDLLIGRMDAHSKNLWILKSIIKK